MRRDATDDLFARLVGRALAIELSAPTASDMATAALLREAAARLVRRENPELARKVQARQWPDLKGA